MDSDVNSEAIHKSLISLTINEGTAQLQSDLMIMSSDSESTSSQQKAQQQQQQSQSQQQEQSIEEKVPLKVNNCLPNNNVPEKIIFCLDTYSDSTTSSFKLNDGSSYSSIYMLKRVIEIFVLNKSYIDPRHEFALLTFDKKNVKWIQELTSNAREIIKSLNNVQEFDEPDNEFDLSVILEQVWQTIKVAKYEKDVPPPYVVRLILLYSRNCVPTLEFSFEELLTNPYFIIDVILSHEQSTEDNKHQEIFDSLRIDVKEMSYSFSVGRNATVLHESMAKLLTHPLQRLLQKNTFYKMPMLDV